MPWDYISIRVVPELKEALKKKAKESDKILSHLCIEYLEEALQNDQEPVATAQGEGGR